MRQRQSGSGPRTRSTHVVGPEDVRRITPLITSCGRHRPRWWCRARAAKTRGLSSHHLRVVLSLPLYLSRPSSRRGLTSSTSCATCTRARARARTGPTRSPTIARDGFAATSSCLFLPSGGGTSWLLADNPRRDRLDSRATRWASWRAHSVSFSLSPLAKSAAQRETVDRHGRPSGRANPPGHLSPASDPQSPSTPIATCSEIDARHPRPVRRPSALRLSRSRFTSVRWPSRHPTAHTGG